MNKTKLAFPIKIDKFMQYINWYECSRYLSLKTSSRQLSIEVDVIARYDNLQTKYLTVILI